LRHPATLLGSLHDPSLVWTSASLSAKAEAATKDPARLLGSREEICEGIHDPPMGWTRASLRALAKAAPRVSWGSGYVFRGFKLPWREAGPPNHHDDKVDSDQWVVNK